MGRNLLVLRQVLESWRMWEETLHKRYRYFVHLKMSEIEKLGKAGEGGVEERMYAKGGKEDQA